MNEILFGDCREIMRRWAEQGVKAQMCVTSPPYFGLRDYGVDGQLGLEQTPDEYVQNMVEVFRAVRDVLADDGTLWLNIGDSYAGSGKGRNADGSHQEGGKQGTNKGTVLGKLIKTEAPDCKQKDLIGIPWMLAFALRADGWYLRQDIIWHKPNPMPESQNCGGAKASRCFRSGRLRSTGWRSARGLASWRSRVEVKTTRTALGRRQNLGNCCWRLPPRQRPLTLIRQAVNDRYMTIRIEEGERK